MPKVRFWEQHRWTGMVEGVRLRYARYVDFLQIQEEWNLTEKEQVEYARIMNKVSLSGTPTDQEEEFLKYYKSKIDLYDLYACCFVEYMTGEDVKNLLGALPRAGSETLEGVLKELATPDMSIRIPAADTLERFMAIGQMPVGLADATIHQGVYMMSVLQKMAVISNGS